MRDVRVQHPYRALSKELADATYEIIGTEKVGVVCGNHGSVTRVVSNSVELVKMLMGAYAFRYQPEGNNSNVRQDLCTDQSQPGVYFDEDGRYWYPWACVVKNDRPSLVQRAYPKCILRHR